MTTRSITLWNVETFGNYPRRNNDMLIMNFFGVLATNYNLDVIIIQELRKNGCGLLSSFAQSLGEATGNQFSPPWDWDYVPAAISDASADVAAGNLTYDDFGFIQSANLEGYAVIAKPNVLDTFSANHSVRGKNKDKSGLINLVLAGAKPVLDGSKSPPIGPDPNDTTMIGAQFPRPHPDLPDNPSSRQEMARLAKNKRLEPNVLQWTRCRRPCHVKVKLTNETLHVVTYHAPVDSYGSIFGTLACGLSDSVRDSKKFGNLVVGGDFNTFDSASQSVAFLNFTNSNMVAGTPAGKGDDGSTKYMQSMVRYSRNNQGKELLPENDPCLGNPRDFLFNRLTKLGNNAKVTTKVVDLFSTFIKDHPLALQNNRVIASNVTQTIRNRLSEDNIPAFEINLANQVGTIFQNKIAFPNRLTLAWFYRNFVSDHLPLLILIDDGVT